VAREHSAIKMSRDEVAHFVATQTRCVVATLDAGGAPWGDAAACVFHDGALYFRIPSDTRTARNLSADRRVCCALESHPAGADYYTIKAAMLHGRAFSAEGASPEVLGALEQLPDPVTGAPNRDGLVFGVGLDDVVSFDFAKIVRRFEQ